MELLYADDLVLLADSMKELIEKVKRWRAGLEEKGLSQLVQDEDNEML